MHRLFYLFKIILQATNKRNVEPNMMYAILLITLEYILKSETLDVLHIPAGYVSSIQALEAKSKLVVMSDYHLGEINDDYRYPMNYFIIE